MNILGRKKKHLRYLKTKSAFTFAPEVQWTSGVTGPQMKPSAL